MTSPTPRLDTTLLRTALDAYHTLMTTPDPRQVLLHTDLHPGNILRGAHGWVCIDPKPLVGDPAFGLSPLVESYVLGHSAQALTYRLNTLSERLELDRERVRLWTLLNVVHMAVWTQTYHQDRLDRAHWLIDAA